MTTEAIGSREPARLPRRMTYEAEFLRLMDQRNIIDRRLDELAELIDPGAAPTPVASALPKSKLRLVGRRGGQVLFKGGPING